MWGPPSHFYPHALLRGQIGSGYSFIILLSQAEEFRFAGVMLRSESVRLTVGWCGDADAAQVGRIEEGAEFETKAVDLLLNLPTLTFGHELWVVTGRMRLEVQTAEMSCLQGVWALPY